MKEKEKEKDLTLWFIHLQVEIDKFGHWWENGTIFWKSHVSHVAWSLNTNALYDFENDFPQPVAS